MSYDPLGVTLGIACSVEDHGDHSILRVVVVGTRCPQAWPAPLTALGKCYMKSHRAPLVDIIWKDDSPITSGEISLRVAKAHRTYGRRLPLAGFVITDFKFRLRCKTVKLTAEFYSKRSTVPLLMLMHQSQYQNIPLQLLRFYEYTSLKNWEHPV
ncbi:hypothetical protein GGP41_006716 [Bipolaris sorokiniana]|uniref:Uncharacterized protein n=1 Tax=Cochliobolus sativus TaxID=45130 RepID=A0A8H6E0W1_COCSA|nr:hypothetical protein GGP41_006716 [Bipolaris sorokiniana]